MKSIRFRLLVAAVAVLLGRCHRQVTNRGYHSAASAGARSRNVRDARSHD